MRDGPWIVNDLPAPTVLDCDPARSAADWTSKRTQLQSLVDSHADEATAAVTALHDELLQLQSPEDTSTTVECLLLIAQYFYYAAQPFLALSAASKACSLASATEIQALLRRGLSLRGLNYVETGNIAVGMESLLEALKVARSMRNPGAEAPVWINLGVALMNSAQYGDALESFERAAALAKDSEDFRQVEKFAHANIADCAAQLHDVRRGLGAARRAIELNPDPRNADECFVPRRCRGRSPSFYWKSAKYHRPKSTANLRVRSRPGPQRQDRIMSSRSQPGLVDVHAKRTDVGLTRLRRALELARNSVRGEVQGALTVCAAGYEAAGQADIALVYLHELLALNRERISEQLLAQVRTLAPGIAAQREVPPRFADPADAKALELEATVRRSIDDLVTAAITGAESAGHQRQRPYRVARLAELFALSEGWTADRAEALAFAARLRDLGMMVIPAPRSCASRGLVRRRAQGRGRAHAVRRRAAHQGATGRAAAVRAGSEVPS